MAEYHGVLICSEVVEGKTDTITRELLNIGRRLSDDLSQQLSILLIGKDAKEAAKEVITLGADKVYTINGSSVAEPHPEFYVAMFAQVCQELTPSIVLLGQTDMGRDVAPRLAARLGSTVTVDCTELAIDPDTKRLLQTKLVYGGNAMAVWVSESDATQIVTLRPRSVVPAEPDDSRKGEVITLSVTVDDSMVKSKLLETVKEEVEGIKLEEAKVIVAGGGGIGGKEGFSLLEELAGLLGGTVAVTRVPCDEGWKPLSLEIGQTGHIVSPNLYVAVGISGAPQHMAGCSGSRWIVAINRDPEAHIFKEANFGIVGNYQEVLPVLIEKCKTLVK